MPIHSRTLRRRSRAAACSAPRLFRRQHRPSPTARSARRPTRRVRACGWTSTRSSSTPPTIKASTRRSSARFRNVRFEQQRGARPSRRADELLLRTDRGREAGSLSRQGPNAPIFVFVHGGAWRSGVAKDYAYPAELFVNAGANYIALDFIDVGTANGDIGSWPTRCGAVSPGPTRTPRASAAMPAASMSAVIPRAAISAALLSRPTGRRTSDCRPT